MKCSVQGADLGRAVNVLKTIVRKESLSTSVTSGILVAADVDGLTLSATNLEHAARVRIPADVKQSGTAVVPAAKFVSVVGLVRADAVTVSVGESRQMTLKAGTGTWRLAGSDPSEFPDLQTDQANGIEVDGELLAEGIKRIAYAVSHDFSRPTLCGARFRFTGREVVLDATDGHRLTRVSVPLKSAGDDADALVPAEALKTLVTVLETARGTVRLSVTDNALYVRTDDVQYMTRLIEGKYPDLDRVIPKPSPTDTVLTVDAAVLRDAVARVVVLAEDRNRPVQLVLRDGIARVVSVGAEADGAEVVLPVETPDDVVIRFNGTYLTQYLDVAGQTVVTIRMRDTLAPVVFEGEGAPLAVIMPLRA